jgi:hypothetical protein
MFDAMLHAIQKPACPILGNVSRWHYTTYHQVQKMCKRASSPGAHTLFSLIIPRASCTCYSLLPTCAQYWTIVVPVQAYLNVLSGVSCTVGSSVPCEVEEINACTIPKKRNIQL